MAIDLPYPVRGTVYSSDGTTAMGAGVIVYLRNESSNEKISTLTDSDGKYFLDAANLAGGYNNGDILTVFVIYSNYEASESHTISGEGGYEQDLILSEVEDSSTIYYCTVQNVLDELDGKTTSDISAMRIVRAIQRAERIIEDKTGQKFRSVTVTNEIYDWNEYTSWKSPEQLGYVSVNDRHDYLNAVFNDRFRLNHYPIISITSLEKNEAGANSTDSWTALTEQTGSGGDFVVDKDTGIIDFINRKPRFGKRSIRVSYTYGYSSTPKSVERLTILLAVKDILLSKISSSQFDNIENISFEGISITKGTTSATSYIDSINKEIEQLWEIVGTFINTVV